jgi:hypothetical protein
MLCHFNLIVLNTHRFPAIFICGITTKKLSYLVRFKIGFQLCDLEDIDGTITRSDVMGHVAALLSKDWTHTGVAGLFSAIEKNGYKFVYLSSRSISHAGSTRGRLPACSFTFILYY